MLQDDEDLDDRGYLHDRHMGMLDRIVGVANGTPPKGATLFGIYKGKVKQIKDFGAFVALDGVDRDGLLHISKISKQPIEKVEDVLSRGATVWVKICHINDDGKFSLDMRHVSQTDGTDNDPNNIASSAEDSKRKGSNLPVQKIQLEAVYNTTCTRCGGIGHLNYECYSRGGDKYTLIPEPLEPTVPSGMVPSHPTKEPPVETNRDISDKRMKRKLQNKHNDSDKKRHNSDKKHRIKARKHRSTDSLSESSSGKESPIVSHQRDSSSDVSEKEKKKHKKRKHSTREGETKKKKTKKGLKRHRH